MAQKHRTEHSSNRAKHRPSMVRKGGVSAERLARAEGVIKKMTANYLEWVENDLNTLERAVAGLKLGNENAMDIIDEIYRCSHDVKGQGGSFGFHLMTEIGALVCRYIEPLDRVTDDDVKILDLCVKAMRQVIDGRLSGDGGSEGRRIMDDLAPVVKKAKPIRA